MDGFPTPEEAKEMKLPLWGPNRREVIEDLMHSVGITAVRPNREALVLAAEMYQKHIEIGLEPPLHLRINNGI